MGLTLQQFAAHGGYLLPGPKAHIPPEDRAALVAEYRDARGQLDMDEAFGLGSDGTAALVLVWEVFWR